MCPIRTSRPAAVVPSPAASTTASVFPAGPRRWATWSWNTGALDTSAALTAHLKGQKRTGANEVFLSGYPVAGREKTLKAALEQARALGLEPQVLLGSPEWSDRATRPWLERSIVGPLKTLRSSIPAATTPKLTVHLDVEPHVTGPLTEAKMRDYLDTLDWLRGKLGPGFALQVDVPCWYAGQKAGGRDFMQQILERVDGVTLMAYERSAQQVVADVTPTLAQAARLGKQALVAIEAGPQYARQQLATADGVRRVLSQLDAALGGKPGYGGCAVHELSSVR